MAVSKQFGKWVVVASLAWLPMLASGQTIVDEWPSVAVPAVPKLSDIKVNPSTTALLMLDFVSQTCPKRPRCMASLPKVNELLQQARAHHILVVYTGTVASGETDVMPQVAKLPTEPWLKSGPDKFINTSLESLLRSKGIQTVIAVGVAAHGAVLHTASHAGFVGFNVVVPVDGMSADVPYAEQYTAWHVVNAPMISTKAVLTSIDQLHFE